MCLSCGCHERYESHGEPANITMQHLKDADLGETNGLDVSTGLTLDGDGDIEKQPPIL